MIHYLPARPGIPGDEYLQLSIGGFFKGGVGFFERKRFGNQCLKWEVLVAAFQKNQRVGEIGRCVVVHSLNLEHLADDLFGGE